MTKNVKDIENSANAVPSIIEIIFDRWTTLIHREIFYGVHRFEQIRSNLGIARNILSVRLQVLVEAGILTTVRYNQYPARYEYIFTEMGLELYPLIITLTQWGDKWLSGLKGPPKIIYHITCEHTVIPATICSSCGQLVTVGDVGYEEGTKTSYISNYANRRLLNSRKRKPSEKASQIENACSVQRTLTLMGDRWTFLILREAFFGARKFDQFYRELGISKNILTSRLKELVNNGIFIRHMYSEHPCRYEYRLTKKGIDLYPIILASIRWENKWALNQGVKSLVLHHKTCGNIFNASVICAHCGIELKAEDIIYHDGPGYEATYDENDPSAFISISPSS